MRLGRIADNSGCKLKLIWKMQLHCAKPEIFELTRSSSIGNWKCFALKNWNWSVLNVHLIRSRCCHHLKWILDCYVCHVSLAGMQVYWIILNNIFVTISFGYPEPLLVLLISKCYIYYSLFIVVHLWKIRRSKCRSLWDFANRACLLSRTSPCTYHSRIYSSIKSPLCASHNRSRRFSASLYASHAMSVVITAEFHSIGSPFGTSINRWIQLHPQKANETLTYLEPSLLAIWWRQRQLPPWLAKSAAENERSYWFSQILLDQPSNLEWLNEWTNA